MPYGVQPECNVCKTSTTTLWRKNEQGNVVCSECMARGSINVNITTPAAKEDKGTSSDQQTPITGNGNQQITSSGGLRKSARTKVTKQKTQPAVKSSAPKGKGRRIIFKKSATKAPSAVASVVTSNSVFHKGSYYQVGDIVSMVDVDGDVYYAQIRGLLQDQYCDKSAVITWLLPSDQSPKDIFDPMTYILGPEEEIPRKLDCMEFICHAPSEYFKAKNSPYATISEKPDLCFIWTRLKPQIKPVLRQDDVFSETQ